MDILKRYYDAIVFSYGASHPRKLGIEGEDLPGVYSAGDFVSWYNGLPSHREAKFNLEGEDAVVIGHGNVALDVARILLTPPEMLAKTDITNFALEQLKRSKVKNVSIVGRRGVLQASFTVKELRELTTLPGVRFNTTLPPDIPAPKSLPRIKQRIVQLLQKAPFIPAAELKKCDLLFLLNPTRFVDQNSHVSGVEFEHQRLLDPVDPYSKIEALGTKHILKADIVFTSIGYYANTLDGMNHLGSGVAVIRGVIPNDKGRVKATSTKDFGYVDLEAAATERVPGVYASGWVKTGPTGVIATTMYSAFETGDSLVEDWHKGKPFLDPEAETRGWEGFKEAIKHGNRQEVNWDGWRRIDEEEKQRGAHLNKEREKLVDVQEMMDLVTPK